MTQILNIIHADHRNYSILLSMISTDIENLQNDRQVDYIRLYDIMNYMTNYPDIRHHPTEEVIFHHLQEKKPEAAKHVNELIAEHRQLAESGASLKEKLHHVTSGSMMSRDAIIKACVDYHALLTRHINFEESQLIPLIESTFTASDWDKVQSTIDQEDDPLFGEAVDEQFYNLFKQISSYKDNTQSP